MSSSDDPDENKMPLLDHLAELRGRLLKSAATLIVLFFVSYFFAPDIFMFLVQPLADAMQGDEHRRLIYTALHEAFFTYVKVAFFSALFLGFPMIATQVWMFIAPGLYKDEKAAFRPFLIATPLLFLLGAAMAYYVVFPLAWRFFLGFETAAGVNQMAIQLEPKVDQYLSLVMRLIMAFGISFELPVAITLLVRAGLATPDGLAAKRKYAIVVAFIAAAILTPPDVISQFLLAVPIIILFEISIWCARLTERKRAERRAAEDDAEDE